MTRDEPAQLPRVLHRSAAGDAAAQNFSRWSAVLRRRVEPGTVDAVLSYCHCALNDKLLLEFLPYLQEKGVAVINGSVLSMGLLTDKVLSPRPLSIIYRARVHAVPFTRN